jgi:hypothetical protein
MKNIELAWDRLSQKERALLITQWEIEDAYPYGQSNSKKNTDTITSHYLRKRVVEFNEVTRQVPRLFCSPNCHG